VYCCKDCQKEDWKVGHKQECQAVDEEGLVVSEAVSLLFGTGQESFDDFFEDGFTLIDQEYRRGNKPLQSLWLKGIVKYDGNINRRENFTGKTMLHLAAMIDNSAMVRLLMKRGANLEVPSGSGPAGGTDSTPLIVACSLNAMDAARTLVEAGANVEARTRFQRTPLLMCKPSVANLTVMKDWGANLHATDANGCGLAVHVMKSFVMNFEIQGFKLTRQEMEQSLAWCRIHGVTVPADLQASVEGMGNKQAQLPQCPQS
jgi:ankyrin repeat protein